MMKEILCIYGTHPVTEALTHAPQIVQKVFVNKEDEPEIDALAKKHEIFRIGFDAKQIGKKHIPEGAVHQHVAAFINLSALIKDLDGFLETVDMTTNPSLAILGEIQDPHNVGAIIRSAAAFGVSGVLIPENRQAQLTGGVIKASAGMAFRVPLIGIGNVNQTIATLKEKRFWIYGLSGTAEKAIGNEVFTEPSVFIVGNEGKGIREKTSEHCDVLLKIPMHGSAESLNASVSAAVTFYEWSKNRP